MLIGYPSGSPETTPKIRQTTDADILSSSHTVPDGGCPVSRFVQMGPFSSPDVAKQQACLSRFPMTFKIFSDTTAIRNTVDENDNVTSVAPSVAVNIANLKKDVMALIGKNPWEGGTNQTFQDGAGPDASYGNFGLADAGTYLEGHVNTLAPYDADLSGTYAQTVFAPDPTFELESGQLAQSHSLGLVAHLFQHWKFLDNNYGRIDANGDVNSSGLSNYTVRWGRDEWKTVRANIAALFVPYESSES